MVGGSSLLPVGGVGTPGIHYGHESVIISFNYAPTSSPTDSPTSFPNNKPTSSVPSASLSDVPSSSVPSSGSPSSIPSNGSPSSLPTVISANPTESPTYHTSKYPSIDPTLSRQIFLRHLCQQLNRRQQRHRRESLLLKHRLLVLHQDHQVRFVL